VEQPEREHGAAATSLFPAEIEDAFASLLVNAPEEDGSPVERTWLRRPAELFTTWGSVYYDHRLRRLPSASDQAWLEVRLLRLPHAPECQAICEVRTRFALAPRGRGAAKALRVIREIGRLQQQWRERFGMPFPEYGTVKPYVRDASGVLTRVEGRRSRIGRATEAVAIHRAVEGVADAWQVCRHRSAHATTDDVLGYLRREIVDRPGKDAYALLHEEDADMARLFAPEGQARRDECRPSLSRRLIFEVGKALGFLASDGHVQAGLPRLRLRGLKARLLNVVAQLAARRGERPDTLLRTIVRPALKGKLAGPLVLTTEGEVKRRRRRRVGRRDGT
jgi:hypothetical protein